MIYDNAKWNAARINAEISSVELADECNLSRLYFLQIESGNRVPTQADWADLNRMIAKRAA